MQKCKLNEAKLIVSELCNLLKCHLHVECTNGSVHIQLRQLLNRLLPCIIVLRSYETHDLYVKVYDIVSSAIQHVLEGTQNTREEHIPYSLVPVSPTSLTSTSTTTTATGNMLATSSSLLSLCDYNLNANNLVSNCNSARKTECYHSKNVTDYNENTHSRTCSNTELITNASRESYDECYNDLTATSEYVHKISKRELFNNKCYNCTNNNEIKNKCEEANFSVHVEEDHVVRWADVDGCDEAITAIKQATLVPLQFPFFFNRNRQPWRRILLYGPPGTGKTLLARATACELGIPFLHFSSADILSKWVGNSEKQLRCVFSRAARLGRCVLFFDEIDALCGARGASGESELARRIKTEFLLHLQSVPLEVVILAATNLPWEIDSAFHRRFDRFLYIGLPTEHTRRKLIRRHLKSIFNTLTMEDIEWTVSCSENFSSSDVVHLVQHAVMCPLSLLLDADALRHATADEIHEYLEWCEAELQLHDNTLPIHEEIFSSSETISSATAAPATEGTTTTAASHKLVHKTIEPTKARENIACYKNEVYEIDIVGSAQTECQRLKVVQCKNIACKVANEDGVSFEHHNNNNGNKRVSLTSTSSSSNVNNTTKVKRTRAVVLHSRNASEEKSNHASSFKQNVERSRRGRRRRRKSNTADEEEYELEHESNKGNCHLLHAHITRTASLQNSAQHQCCNERLTKVRKEPSCAESVCRVITPHCTVEVNEHRGNNKFITMYYVPCSRKDDRAIPALTVASVAPEHLILPPVKKSDFILAFEAVVPSVSYEEIKRYTEWRSRNA